MCAQRSAASCGIVGVHQEPSRDPPDPAHTHRGASQVSELRPCPPPDERELPAPVTDLVCHCSWRSKRSDSEPTRVAGPEGPTSRWSA
eukprot:2171247-Rhodomonas_salina.1